MKRHDNQDNHNSHQNQKPAKRPGPPSLYSEELASGILKRVAEGETLTQICQEEGMPHRDTVYGWMEQFKGFSDAYALARQRQADAWADEMRQWAQTTTNDNFKPRRVQAEILQWLCERVHPKQYSEKMHMHVTGEVAVGHHHVVEHVRGLSDEELEAEIRRQLEVGNRKALDVMPERKGAQETP